MMLKPILSLLLLTIVYALSILALIRILGALSIPEERAIFLAWMLFGLISGVAVVWVWPYDSSSFPNIYAMVLGDAVYQTATARVSPAQAANAHEAIAWIFRIPQVYLLTALALSAIGGLLHRLIVHFRKGWQKRSGE